MIDLNVLFLLYDVSQKESFEELKILIEAIKGIPPKDCIKVLVGNKIDVGSNRKVSNTEGEQLAKQMGLEFYEVSSIGNRETINEIFLEIGKS